jgi:hypothetical protein
VHRDGTLVIRGRAPDGLVFGFPVSGERYRSGDVRV